MNETAKPPLAGDPPASQIHVYSMSTANKATLVIVGIVSFCLAGWFCVILSVPHLRARVAPDGQSTTGGVVMALFFFGLGVADSLPLRTRLILTSSQVVVMGWVTYTIPFSEIQGFRDAGRRSGRGIYLYRRGKSRVFVRESVLELDDFYSRWRASVYDLDKADRLRRKADGKPRMTDWFSVDDSEQHPAIGGPDAPATR